MNKKEIDLLKELCTLQTTYDDTEEFNQWFFNQKFKNCKIHQDDSGNIYVVKGTSETYPCIVAHTDRVCKEKEKERFVLQVGNNLVAFNENAEQIDVFGDDTSGVFVAIKMLEELDNVKVVFFWGEESGMQGSKKVDMSFFENCRFVLQCDRKHDKADFITFTNGVETCSDNFVTACLPFMEKYGYQKTNGVATDIGQLRINGLKVCSVNLSAGYYKAHSNKGYINILKLNDCLNLVRDICTNLKLVFNYEPKQFVIEEFEERDIFTPIIPTRYKKSKFGSDAYEEGWLGCVEYLISLSEEEYWNVVQEIEIQRLENINERVNEDVYDLSNSVNLLGCSKYSCWENMIKGEDFDGTPLYSCVKCNKEFK